MECVLFFHKTSFENHSDMKISESYFVTNISITETLKSEKKVHAEAVTCRNNEKQAFFCMILGSK